MAVYNSNYTGAQVDAAVGKVSDITKTAAQINALNQVNANPSPEGTSVLSGVQIGSTKYTYKNIIDATNDTSLLPTADNTSGVMIFVLANEADVVTEYDGYTYYLI